MLQRWFTSKQWLRAASARARIVASRWRGRPQRRDGSDGTCADPDHQRYLHTLPDTDQKNHDTLTRMTGMPVRDRMT